jgi:hypothetical protein
LNHLNVINLFNQSVYSIENPKVVASVQRRLFTEKFRNFVDLCVQRQDVDRPTSTELLQHPYLKKMKLQNCSSILQCSILAEGIVDLQRKCSTNSENDENEDKLVVINQSNIKTVNINWDF